MQLEDMSKDQLIELVKKQETELGEYVAIPLGEFKDAQPVQQPELTADWKLVPVEPTKAMYEAARRVPESVQPYPPHFSLIWDAMLAATPIPVPAASVQAWQPIATAPNDGRTLLLGAFNSMGNWRTMRGQWFSQAEIDDEWEDPNGLEAGWYETAVEPDAPNCWSISPTHWMPLPGAPVDALSKGAGELWPLGYSVNRAEGHGWYVTTPSGDKWVAHENTPVADFIATLAQRPASAAPEHSIRTAAKLVLRSYDEMRGERTDAPEFAILRNALNQPASAADSGRDAELVDVDSLAQFIRMIDGNNTMGAGALAEKISEWLAAWPSVFKSHPAASVAQGEGQQDAAQEALETLPRYSAIAVQNNGYEWNAEMQLEANNPPAGDYVRYEDVAELFAALNKKGGAA